MSIKENFQGSAVNNVVKELVSKRVGSGDEAPLECEVYNLMDCAKPDLELVNTHFKTNIQKVDENAADDANKEEQQKKSDEAIKKMYLQAINSFDPEKLSEEYAKVFDSLKCLYAGQTLLLLLKHSELSQVLPILFSSRENESRFTCFLKSNFNIAQLSRKQTGQKGDLKSLKALWRRVFEFCSKEENGCQGYIQRFLHDDILLPGL